MIRRAIGTTLVGFCALTGPLASGVFAASADATLSLSATSARPGAVFTVSPGAGLGCPAEDGVQTVQLTFTDHAGAKHALGATETEDDGSWADARALLPVAGLDADGAWSADGVAAGAGKVSAACFVSDDPGDDGDDSATDGADDSADADSEDTGDDGAEDPGEDTGDPDDGDDPGDDTADEPTRTYAGIAFTVAGSARKLSLSTSMITPGGSVTVTPGEGCAVVGESTVEIAVISLSDTDDGDGEEDGDGESGDDSALPTTFVTTSATGTWSPVTLKLPADTETGDYAVTADCNTGDLVTSSYDAEALAVGTVVINAADCGARAVFSTVSGTYGGAIAGSGDVTLPTKLKLAGDGPWKIKIRSEITGELLAARTVSCAKPQYELEVAKTGLSDSNKVRARACNTGRAPVTAILQLAKEKKFQKVDKLVLAPGECDWLEGPKLDKGSQVKAQVLIDAPGKGSDDVVESFTAKRPRR
jgi:hypothetical protein